MLTTWRRKYSAFFLAPLLALLLSVLCHSLWWFAAGAMVLFAILQVASRATERLPDAKSARHPDVALSTGTLVSLMLYAALTSCALLTARAALGRLAVPIAFDQTSPSVYEQCVFPGFLCGTAELRLGWAELLMLFASLTLVFMQWARYWALTGAKPLVLHPTSAV